MGRKEYLKKSWTSPKVTDENSPTHGRGLFAKEPIAAGETVVVWGGEFVNEASAQKAKGEGKAAQQLAEDIWDVFDYETRHDDSSYNHNHSCDPNTWMQDEVTITTRRDITPGEELTIDYAMLVIDDEWVMQELCKCGSTLCRHKITGLDWQRKDLQERYRDHFSPFINARIASANA
ncbi:SET domain-containing protein-lysine N-methyltransferase [Candidatus Kaiserbacteria bacterium]|nr:SET domain-containing protein-lysine N-methyltransferase [Candidatus Kaiserbacteria bacterium]